MSVRAWPPRITAVADKDSGMLCAPVCAAPEHTGEAEIEWN